MTLMKQFYMSTHGSIADARINYIRKSTSKYVLYSTCISTCTNPNYVLGIPITMYGMCSARTCTWC